MARLRKMISEEDISKNSSVKISGTINRIKANERKYTIYLVIIFMFLFTIVGYFTLKFNVDDYNKDLKKDSITLNSDIVTLSEEDRLSDLDGLKSKSYKITIESGIEEATRYRIRLVKDDTLTDMCGCLEEIKPSDLRVSFDGDIVTYNNFDDIVIDTGKIRVHEVRTTYVKIWLSEDATTHFHGRFILEKTN